MPKYKWLYNKFLKTQKAEIISWIISDYNRIKLEINI